MKHDFDFQSVTITEFGVGLENTNGQRFVLIPVDADVQLVLQEMAIATRDAMDKITMADVPVYEPSENMAATNMCIFPSLTKWLNNCD